MTAASHVVHFDRAYNPAKEQQATDRAHRLGQKNMVCVHKMATTGTYEDKLDAILKQRAALGQSTFLLFTLIVELIFDESDLFIQV